ncbi:MAG: hypothetical protein JST44_24555 [Cyanobacteria bacterium SZAS LIN-5]|nr:hypothetical protein [Cyanobacteria bacterium SZAS LIN-5]
MQVERAESPTESFKTHKELTRHVYSEIEQSFRHLLQEAKQHHESKHSGAAKATTLDFGTPDALYKHSHGKTSHAEGHGKHHQVSSSEEKGHGKVEHGNGQQGKVEQERVEQGKGQQGKVEQGKTEQGKGQQGKVEQAGIARIESKPEANKVSDATPAPGSPEANLRAQRDQLEQKARERMSPADFEKFQGNMNAFEARMTKMEEQYRLGGDSPEAAHKRALNEASKTYEQTSRLLADKADAPTGVTAAQRVEIAKTVMSNAAVPTSIDQGYHNTCNVNTVEVRAFTRTPSDATKVIVDSAMTGSFTTKDGHNIVIDKGSLQPDKEASQIPTRDGARNYASQIFQVAAVNAFYQPESKGQIRYCVTKPDGTAKPPSDGGDFLMDYSQNPPQKMTDPNSGVWKRFKMWWNNESDHYSEQPNLGWTDIKKAGDRITGDKSDWYVAQWNGGKTEEEFTQRIADAKAKGNLPLVVQVHTGNEPFYTDSNHGAAGGSGGAHVVTIQDYIPGPPAKVKIDNSWGSAADHNSDSKAVSVHDLFIAMRHNPQESIALQQKDVDANKAAGKVDDYKAVDLLRMQHDNGIVTGAAYEKALVERMQDIKKHLDEGTISAEDYSRTMLKLNGMISLAPNGKSIDLRAEEHRLGLLNDSTYSQWVAYEFTRIAADRKKAIKSGSYDTAAELNWCDTVKSLKKSLNAMPEEQRNYVVERLKAANAFRQEDPAPPAAKSAA